MLNLTSDQLPGLLFYPVLCYYDDSNIYTAESLEPDFNVKLPQVRARWICASPQLNAWTSST